MINASGNTLIIDIRDELSFEYGHIDGAVNIPAEKLDKSDLPKDKKLLICCKSGLISDTEAEKLRELGYDAENLEGGYYGWLSAYRAARIQCSWQSSYKCFTATASSLSR